MVKRVVLLSVTGMMAFCFYSTAQEEVGTTAREMAESDKTQEDVSCDIYYVDTTIRALFALAFLDTSRGDQENLDWTRGTLGEKDRTDRTDTYGILQVAERYLVMKGDASDLNRVSPSLRELLAARVTGTNLVIYHDLGDPSRLTSSRIIPSVINTGPQGHYVFEILRQYWKTLEIEYREGDRNRPFRDTSKIPAELLTMVVSFDAGGNPVCNVDLAKYGLTMPVLDVPVKLQAGGAAAPSPDGTPEGGLRHSVPPREPGSRLWISAALAALTLLIGVLYARRNKLK